ncbi:hypothetical protein JAAARDRAFT_599186 [Jaapia argillacea MUCL 33604]|uniref:CHAT domain-containing protein n=1 Tax=Jaapia argillacea MUCL 33604 TaxID=933084 RepID=A0A067Q222_9AGAM|nr:hypothetical protein JAAARDRAFT_599186 [Jaapia argillacea MUCL 33604]
MSTSSDRPSLEPQTLPRAGVETSVTRETGLAVPEGSGGDPNVETRRDAVDIAMSRYEQLGDVRFLTRAIKRSEILLRESPCVDDRIAYMSRLGSILMKRYHRTQEIEDVRTAVDNFRAAISESPPGERRSALVLHLVDGLRLLCDQTKDSAAQEELQGLLLDEVPGQSGNIPPTSPTTIKSEGIDPDVQAYIDGAEIQVLDRAIERYRIDFQSAEKVSDSADDLAIRRSLGWTLMRAVDTRDCATLDEAEPHLMAVIEQSPDSLIRAKSLSDLGRLFCTRFDIGRKLSDIEASVSYHQEALKLTEDSTCILLHTQYLGIALLARCKQYGNISDADEVIRRLTALLSVPNPAVPTSHLAAAHACLGQAYHIRNRATREIDDNRAAIESYETALGLMSPRSLRSSLLTGYALTLEFHVNYHVEGHEGDALRMRVGSTHRQALDLFPIDHPDRAVKLANVGNAFRHIYWFRRSPDLIKFAVRCHRKALGLISTTNPERAKHLRNLGTSLVCYSHSDNNKDDRKGLQEGAGALQEAMRLETAPIADRFDAAMTLAHYMGALRYYTVSLKAFEQAISLLPRLAWLGLDIDARQLALKEPLALSLASDAGCTSLNVGYPIGTVGFLESGRSIFWTQVLQLRNPLEDLRGTDLRLASEIQEASGRLEKCSALGSDAEADRQRRELASRWEVLISQARALPGHEHFLLPKSGADISRECSNIGICVIFNINKARCDAIILHPATPVQHVALPDTSRDRLVELAATLRELLSSTGFGRRRHLRPPTIRKVKSSSVAFNSILEELWNSIMSPVIQALVLDGSNPRPRLWICPTGPLSQLPLHAAGIYAKGSQEYLSSYVVVSYTPTLSALISARRPRPNPNSTRLLAIGQADPPGRAGFLSGVAKELSIIQAVSPAGSVTVVEGNTATTDVVLSNFNEANWFHVASHGIQDMKQPLNSALLLADGQLKLSSLMDKRLEHGELAFLSACETATGHETLTNESVHLAAGFLSAGVASVVATLWSIRDEDGPNVAEVFYRYMFRGDGIPSHMDSAYALDEAVRSLRESGTSPERWVSFIHMGA